MSSLFTDTSCTSDGLTSQNAVMKCVNKIFEGPTRPGSMQQQEQEPMVQAMKEGFQGVSKGKSKREKVSDEWVNEFESMQLNSPSAGSMRARSVLLTHRQPEIFTKYIHSQLKMDRPSEMVHTGWHGVSTKSNYGVLEERSILKEIAEELVVQGDVEKLFLMDQTMIQYEFYKVTDAYKFRLLSLAVEHDQMNMVQYFIGDPLDEGFRKYLKYVARARRRQREFDGFEYEIKAGVIFGKTEEYKRLAETNPHIYGKWKNYQRPHPIFSNKLRNKDTEKNMMKRWSVDSNGVEQLNKKYQPGFIADDATEFATTVAAKKGRLDMLKMLLRFEDGTWFESAKDRAIKEETIVHAAANGYENMVRYLLGEGFDPTVRDDRAIKEAAKHGHLEIVQLLADAYVRNQIPVPAEAKQAWMQSFQKVGVARMG